MTPEEVIELKFKDREEYELLKRDWHDKHFRDGLTHHLISEHTHRCVFCGKLDQRGIIPFMHIMGSI